MNYISWVASARRFPDFARCLFAIFLSVASFAVQAQTADLRVQIRAPTQITAGEEFTIAVVVTNRGAMLAKGTESAGDQGYMVDLFVTDGDLPNGSAVFSPNYRPGALLRGGRNSNTKDIGRSRRYAYTDKTETPSDTPTGSYKLCARVDPFKRVADGNRDNNTRCVDIRVSGQSARPAVAAIPEPCSQAKRTILSDGTIEMKYANGLIRRLRPDGSVEEVRPEGMRPDLAPQIGAMTANLPQPPGGISRWGGQLDNRLSAAIKNLLTNEEFVEYKQMESGLGFYEKVDMRLKAIEILTRPATTNIERNP